ncbi:MAG: type II toxin-antitoxin system RelE/ParE family toxin [Erysipelotrichaceae bacterium]|jgi:phage-related protein|nr:type II toxin-antitoxin system RelE/ParE family toxin [Erysipelotrichaceae bacterium]
MEITHYLGDGFLVDFVNEIQKKLIKHNYRAIFDALRKHIKWLEEYGHIGINQQKSEATKKLKGSDVWELKVKNLRIMFVPKNKRIILLSWFIKETKKTPSNEIETAETRLKEYVRRENEKEKKKYH